MPRGTDRYDEAQIQGRLWTPNVLRSAGLLSQWQDGADPSFVDYGTTGVATWRDKSGFARTFTQGTDANRPLLLQGLGLRSEGTARLMSFSSTLSSDHDMVVAVRTNSSSATWRTLLWSAPSLHPCLLESGSNRLGAFDSVFGSSGYTLAVNTYAIIVIRCRPSTGSVQIASDGQTLSSQMGSTISASTIFLNETGGTQPFGDVFEFVRTTAHLSQADLDRTIGYLANKWDRLIGAKKFTSPLVATNP